MKFIPIQTGQWDRQPYFDHYFKQNRCTFSMTANIEITLLLGELKKRGMKLYPAFLYMLSRIVNAHVEFRMDIREEQVGCWEQMSPCYTIFHPENHKVMDDLHVVVRDNGKGMNEDTLMRVRSLLEGGNRMPPKAEDRDGSVLRRGIGLSNVHERIRMMFGSPYGLYLDSQEGEGTTVTIRLPIRHQGGMEDEHFSRGR